MFTGTGDQGFSIFWGGTPFYRQRGEKLDLKKNHDLADGTAEDSSGMVKGMAIWVTT